MGRKKSTIAIRRGKEGDGKALKELVGSSEKQATRREHESQVQPFWKESWSCWNSCSKGLPAERDR